MSARWLCLALLVFGCGERGEGKQPGAAGAAASGVSGAPSNHGAGQSGTSSSGGAGSSGASSHGGAGAAGQGGFPTVELPQGKGWLELPDTKLSSVCACKNGFPEVCANNGCAGIFSWSSGAYDSLRNRLIVFGGGHRDYFGNELYALSLADRTLSRLNDPGLPLADECSPSTAGGSQPASRHTYDTLLYLEHADRLFVFGGSMPPCGYLSDDTWTYSFAEQAWERHQPSGPKPKAVPGIVADYDPQTKRVLLHDNDSLYSYDLEQDAFRELLTDDSIDYHMTAVIEPVARKLVLVGAGRVLVYPLDGDVKASELATSGADELVQSVYPGLAFDAASGRIVSWNGGDSAYALDLESGVWTALTSAKGPGAANETGTFKRWRSVPGSNSFVLVNGPEQNAFLFRL